MILHLANNLRRFPLVTVPLMTAILFLILQRLFPLDTSLENFTSLGLVSLQVALLVLSKPSLFVTLLLGASLGMLFFTNILGFRVVNPTYLAWVMQNDWQMNFFGWHFFRQEEWHFPLGKITQLLFPVGTAITYTDSIPLLALLFKPFNSLLPTDFQYLGLWFLICFVLQGVFGALLLRLLTPHLFIQTLGSLFFVLSPILLVRLNHPALCAHWLLLASLWIYFKPGKHFGGWLILTILSTLIHPYLTAMIFVWVGADYIRGGLIERAVLLQMSSLVLTTLLVGWLVGYFLVSDVSASGLGHFSMNLQAPFNAMGMSVLLKDLPTATTGQYEGFNYLGIGVFLLGGWAIYELIQRPLSAATIKKIWPLLIAGIGLTSFALSNRVTFGNQVLWEFHGEWLKLFSMFQSSGRFFWPVNYLLLFLLITLLIKRNSNKHALLLLSLGLALQELDFHKVHLNYYQTWNHQATWQNPLQSPFWQMATPHYQHLLLVPPYPCEEPNVDWRPFAYLAANHHLTLNTALVARVEVAKVLQSCQQLRQNLRRGQIQDNTLYVLLPTYVASFQTNAQVPVRCNLVDGFNVCVTQASSAKWELR